MKHLHAWAAAILAATLLPGCGEKSVTQNQSPNAADVNNPLVNAKRTADKTIDVSYINQAVQLFNVQEGRNPKTLDELVPKYIAQIPTPPLGYKINYDATSGNATMVRE
jgi:hypothetical protein